MKSRQTQPEVKQQCRYLSIAGLAQKFQVSERTVHKIVGEPWFPQSVLLFGGERGARRWIETEVDAAVKDHAPRRARGPEPSQLSRAREFKAMSILDVPNGPVWSALKRG